MSGEMRLAVENDARQIQAIYAPVVRETAISFELEVPAVDEIAGRIRSTAELNLPWLVLENDGEVLGYAYASTFRSRAAYRWSAEVSVYVHANARRSQVGRKLYSALLRILACQGYHNAYAGTALPNPGSVRLHEVTGFSRIGIYHAVGFKFGAWHDVLWWERSLRDPGVDPAPLLTLSEASTRPQWRAALST